MVREVVVDLARAFQDHQIIFSTDVFEVEHIVTKKVSRALARHLKFYRDSSLNLADSMHLRRSRASFRSRGSHRCSSPSPQKQRTGKVCSTVVLGEVYDNRI